MLKSWLILDCDNICHAVRHTPAGQLDNGITYGFLRSLRAMLRDFAPAQPVFCFDSKNSLRKQLAPNYKSTRTAKLEAASEEEQQSLTEFRKQRSLLRGKYLPALGYVNVLSQEGYEADDLIAAVVYGLFPKETAVIVSSDQDLYQLLSDRVNIWKPIPKKLYTKKDFQKDYSLDPVQWASVKAIAGCTGS